MRAAKRTPTLWTGAGRAVLVILGGGLLACGIIACTAGFPPRPGSATTSAADKQVEATYAERLQALEAGMQLLTQRLNALQAAAGNSRSNGRIADARPAELRPIKPAIVLAANPVRRAPPPPAAPMRAPVQAPEVVPHVLPAEKPVTPQHRPGQGDWVINLASYNNRSFATRKLAEFIDEGVTVEQVQAQVSGKTIYRLRVPGFDSFRAANTEAAAIRAKLGLGDTWIARR